MALRDQIDAELIDERGLAGARHAANADADRLARIGQQRFQQGARARLIFGPRTFNQRDGAAERDAVAFADVLGEVVDGLCVVLTAHDMRG